MWGLLALVGWIIFMGLPMLALWVKPTPRFTGPWGLGWLALVTGYVIAIVAAST